MRQRAVSLLHQLARRLWKVAESTTGEHLDTITLYFSIVRLVSTFVLSANGVFAILSCRAEQRVDEEAQPLLGHANGDTTQQQWRRFAEPDNWIEYLQSFTIFIPHLLPWRDPKIICSLTIRIVVAIINRGLNVAIPRELGIAIDKLSSGPGIMPWKEIALWTCYLWLNSSAGFDILDSLATTRIQNSSYKRITELAMDHIMGLLLDFHSNKDTGEVLKAID